MLHHRMPRRFESFEKFQVRSDALRLMDRTFLSDFGSKTMGLRVLKVLRVEDSEMWQTYRAKQRQLRECHRRRARDRAREKAAGKTARVTKTDAEMEEVVSPQSSPISPSSPSPARSSRSLAPTLQVLQVHTMEATYG